MKKATLTKASLAQLVAEYVTAASRHGQATEAGDSRTANKSADVVAHVHTELRHRGLREALLPLLEHPDPGVRCWAGSHVLEFAPDAAEGVLSSLARQQGSLISFSAEMTLKVWRQGQLKFP